MGARPPTSRTGNDTRRLRAARLLILASLVGPSPATAAGDHVGGTESGGNVADDDPQDLAPGRGGRPSLQLVWCDVLRSTPFPFEEMTAEVERILGGADLDVTWRIADLHSRYDDTEIPVILLDRARASSAASRHVMGSTRRDTSLRAAWVYSSSVRWALGLANTPLLSREHQRDLARGLGRVVAHEIVHVIAPDLPHARTGLMQPAMDRSALRAPGLTLENAHRRVFIARLPSLSRDPGERSAVLRVPGRDPAASGLPRGAALSR